MSFVATLICNPATPALDSTAIEAARAILPEAQPADWLFEGVAADIPFASTEGAREIAARLREAVDDLPVDVVVQPLIGRRKKLFLADMDSTMIGQECIDELADFAGLKAHVAEITERAMRGEIEFEPALRERVALLKGLPVSIVAETIDKRITLTPGGRELVNTMRKHGAYTCLVSGGFTLFTNAIAAKIGFQENRANELIVEDGKFSGRVDRADPRQGREARNPQRAARAVRARQHRHPRRRRRRQRPADDRGGRTRRRLSRQAGGRSGRRRAHRPRRPHRAALRAGVSAG